MRAALLVLAMLAPAAAQTPAELTSAQVGLACVVVALILVWKRRCKQLPQYLPGDIRPTLKAAPGPTPRSQEPAPVAAAAVAASPPPQMEFEAPPTPPPAEDLVFEKAPTAEPEPPLPEPELDPAELESMLLEIQGQFEEQAAQLAVRLENEWKSMQTFLEQARSDQAGPEPIAIPDVEAFGPELRTTANPVPAPDEISGQGWSEPAENGVRSRDGEFLGPLGDPAQPPGPTNARAYYRERRVEEDGLVFREITRGIVVGRQLQVQESSRYPEQGILTLLERHKQRAAEAGAPVAYRLWLTKDHAIKVYATKHQVRQLEPALMELPAQARSKLPDLLVARDLGGRVDWEGAYLQDAEGRPATHAVLADDCMIALRHGLEPAQLKSALAYGLGESLEAGSGETHLVLLEQWDDIQFEPARELKGRLYP